MNMTLEDIAEQLEQGTPLVFSEEMLSIARDVVSRHRDLDALEVEELVNRLADEASAFTD